MQHKKEPQALCPYCSSKSTIRRGGRKRKFRTIQQFQCKSCQKFFSPETNNRSQSNKTYPISTILSSISAYNLGYTLKEASEKAEKKFKIKIPVSTLSSWLSEYKKVCAFARLRNQAIKLYTPKEMIQKQTLSHIQPYTFKYHKAKLDILTKENPQFNALKDYIAKLNSKDFPHHILLTIKIMT